MDFGKGFFVTPSDFVAIIAAYVVQAISYFPGGLKGVARSMCTLAALDVVAKNTNLIFFEMLTGRKFFGMTTHLEPELALALRISMDEENVLDAANKQNRQESIFNLLDLLLSDDMMSGDDNSDESNECNKGTPKKANGNGNEEFRKVLEELGVLLSSVEVGEFVPWLCWIN
ncbi:uncharacterized protein LOC121782026 [Salvia splendens]|nr:uncharacterized protein LOC121782026 [Salvia splendens]XP_042035664.1 uncharacterized protein LOC121782026 [Salvia splendens]